ncbi:hypothetical protein [Streptosporangium saharense]|uniref:hypothetical protein n=1 Tax=Streptosporangium saharense TaxID=1706840 RepID=UPI003318F37C
MTEAPTDIPSRPLAPATEAMTLLVRHPDQRRAGRTRPGVLGPHHSQRPAPKGSQPVLVCLVLGRVNTVSRR